MEQKKKRTGLVIALVACLALVGVAGVMAWYSSTSEITNNFVDGGITEPGTDPTNPDKPLRPEVTPDPEHNGHQGQVNGNIVENQWIDKSKVTPGSSIPKNPNVGIGKSSDSCYVFVNVKNNFTLARTSPSIPVKPPSSRPTRPPTAGPARSSARSSSMRTPSWGTASPSR